MIIGQTLMGAGTYYSPWFPRQGDTANITTQVIGCSGNGSLTFIVQTKNIADTDTSPATLGTFSSTANTPGIYPTGGTLISNIKELLRFQYILTTASSFAHFRVLPPAWEAN
jgi:hypothetical protein